MSTRPNSELLAISKKRGLHFERFYRELNFDPARALGWYGAVGNDHVVWLGYDLQAAKVMLEAMPVKKLNGKIKAALATVEKPKSALPATPIVARRRARR